MELPSLAVATNFSANLVRGIGQSYFTQNATELSQLLKNTLKLFRVSIVG